MRSYGQYCPISRGAEVFATRWTPLIVRNLLLGCRTFTEILGGVPGISRTLLAQRLTLLEHHGIVVRRPADGGRGNVYELTEAGRELEAVCDALAAWGARWIELAPEHCDPGMVLWTLCRILPDEALPDRRFVVRFDVRDASPRRLWLLVDPPDAEVCAKPPGESDDLVVSTTAGWLTRWHVGEVTLGAAMHAGHMRVEGPRSSVRMLARWGGLGARPLAEILSPG